MNFEVSKFSGREGLSLRNGAQKSELAVKARVKLGGGVACL